MAALPTGTVTFLFTDIEGSTRLLGELGADAYAAALTEHRLLLREAFLRHAGAEVDTQGDAFFVAFADARAAGLIRVRMGLHTGTPHLTAEGYVGEEVTSERASPARAMAARSCCPSRHARQSMATAKRLTWVSIV